MRQTLLRIRLDSLWSLEPIDGVTAVGIGWLLIPWLAYAVWWGVSNRRHLGANGETLTSAGIWLAVAGGLLTAPLWAARMTAFVPVYGYGFMLFVGFLSACWWATRRTPQVGIPSEAVWDVAMWIFVGGIGGARLFYLIQYGDRVFAGKHGLEVLQTAVNLPDGGLVLYGGVILGTVAYVLFCRLRKIDPLLMADALIPSVFVGLAFGRLGCFLNGCCYGDVCTLPWAVTFPEGSVPFSALVARGQLPAEASASLPLHPTQIYSSLNAALLALLTHAYFRYRPSRGAVVAVGLTCYPITRFALESLRADELGQFQTSLTISQWVSLGLFGVGLLFSCWVAWRGGSPAGRGAGARVASSA